VVHLRDGKQQCFKNQQLVCLQTEQKNHGDSSDSGAGEFAGVKAGRTADIHSRVTVMHAMESPECGNAMAGEVPAPGPQIQQQNGSKGSSDTGEWQCRQQADFSAGGEFGGGDHQTAGQCQHGQAIDGSQCVIACGVPEF